MEPLPETEQVLQELKKYGDTEIAVTLLEMGRRAREMVPECVGLSLAVLDEGLTFTLVASSDDCAAFDAVQYLDGGPCVEAAERREPLEVSHADLFDEGRWLMYATATATAGVASTLSLPIVRSGHVIGTVNLYAATPDAFNGHHEELASALGASAESAMTNADLSFSTRHEAANAPAALAEQYDVDSALGIIAQSKGVDIATARTRLQQAAARAGITEAQAARALRSLYAG